MITLGRDTWVSNFVDRSIGYSDIVLNTQLLLDMSRCWQSKELGVSVLDHGLDVWSNLLDILHMDYKEMEIPDKLRKSFFHILTHESAVLPVNSIKRYVIYHDCGKPYCRIVDEHGRQHFPRHAEVSAMTYRQTFPNECVVISNLIYLDMLFHTETADKIESMNLPQEWINTLLLAAVAEVNSNAQMFGGYDSDSFKIKFKKINRRFNRFFKID